MDILIINFISISIITPQWAVKHSLSCTWMTSCCTSMSHVVFEVYSERERDVSPVLRDAYHQVCVYNQRWDVLLYLTFHHHWPNLHACTISLWYNLNHQLHCVIGSSLVGYMRQYLWVHWMWPLKICLRLVSISLAYASTVLAEFIHLWSLASNRQSAQVHYCLP